VKRKKAKRPARKRVKLPALRDGAMDRHLDDIEKACERVLQQFDDRLERSEARLGNLTMRIDAVISRINEVDAGVVRLTEQSRVTGTAVANLEREDTPSPPVIARRLLALENNRRKQENYQDSRMTQFQVALHELRSDFAKLYDRVVHAQGTVRLTQCETEIRALRADVDKLMERSASVQDVGELIDLAKDAGRQHSAGRK
jgi:hypothetical protein